MAQVGRTSLPRPARTGVSFRALARAGAFLTGRDARPQDVTLERFESTDETPAAPLPGRVLSQRGARADDAPPPPEPPAPPAALGAIFAAPPNGYGYGAPATASYGAPHAAEGAAPGPPQNQQPVGVEGENGSKRQAAPPARSRLANAVQANELFAEASAPPTPPFVLIGHAASFTPY